MSSNIILLAAGNGTRFGGDKMLFLLHDRPMYRYITDNAIKIKQNCNNINQVILVSRYEEIKQAIAGSGIDYVDNPHPEYGISHSIRLGLEHAGKADYNIFAVCDQPALTYETFAGFITGLENSGCLAGAVGWKGQLYNPCGFHESLREELFSLQGDCGGKRILKKHMDSLFIWQAESEKEIIDMDVREERI